MKIRGRILNFKKENHFFEKEELIEKIAKHSITKDNYFLNIDGCYGYGLEDECIEEFKKFKIKGVIAHDFTPIQYRNLINSGILPLKKFGNTNINDNTDIEVDLKNCKILNGGEEKLNIAPINTTLFGIYNSGGLLNFKE